MQDNELRRHATGGAAQSGAVPADPSRMDPDLMKVIDAWASLPEAVRTGIVAMVNAARQ
jgi:hypothetical protein